MVTQLPYSKLIEDMNRQDTLAGWDVLVAYNQVKLNDLLANSPQGTSLPLSFEQDIYNPYDENTSTYSFNIKLVNPVLQLHDEVQSNCTLTYDLTGTYQDEAEGSPQKAIPDGASVVVNAYLNNLSGTVSTVSNATQFTVRDAVLFPDPALAQTQQANYVVAVGVDDPAQGLCIVFSSCTVTILNPNSDSQIEWLSAYLTNGIMSELPGGAFYYYLGGVDGSSSVTATETSADTTTVTLTPTKFAFTIVEGDQPEDSAVLMWIGVDGGDGGGLPPGKNNDLGFKLQDKTSSPIPQGKTASVLFSYRLIRNKVFQEMFQGNQFDDFQDRFSLAGGMHWAVYYKQRIHVDGTQFLQGTTQEYVDDLDFSTDCNWTFIDIQPTLSSKEDDMEISYSCDQTVTAFFLNTDTGEKIDESFVITYSFNQTGQWTAKTTDSQELNVFTVEWNQDDLEWQMNLKSGHLPQIWDGQIPDYYRPALDLSKTNIDYTPTTNILFPGQYVFLADPVRPDANYTQGLAAPHDLILTGDITSSV